MISEALLAEAEVALARLPTTRGGDVIVLATAGSPPAVAMLSTGDVWIDGLWVRVAVHATGSAVSRLGGAFSLLFPARDHALRVEVVPAESRVSGDLAVLEGPIVAVRPTSEPPWVIDLVFRPEGATAIVEPFLTYCLS